jgi:hypothetical protein
MIGEYGEYIADAPYILEPLIDGFGEEASHQVRMELLTATMKLFFKRPPEMKKMLGRLLSVAIADVGKVDVRDRALMYYRLLRLDVLEAARVVNCPKVIVDVFAETVDPELKEKIFAEFNSLSVTYGIPSERFVDEKKNKDPDSLIMAEGFDREDPEKEEGKDTLLDEGARREAGASEEGKENPSSSPRAVPATGSTATPATTTTTTPAKKDVDFLSGFGDFEPPTPSVPPASPASAATTARAAVTSPASFDPLASLMAVAAPTPAAPSLVLQPTKVDPPTFQAKWTQLPVAGNVGK